MMFKLGLLRLNFFDFYCCVYYIHINSIRSCLQSRGISKNLFEDELSCRHQCILPMEKVFNCPDCYSTIFLSSVTILKLRTPCSICFPHWQSQLIGIWLQLINVLRTVLSVIHFYFFAYILQFYSFLFAIPNLTLHLTLTGYQSSLQIGIHD